MVQKKATHRVFFALELSSAMQQQLANYQQRLPVLGGRQVPPANFHITLLFVGEISPPLLDRLLERVQTVRQNPFSIETGQAIFWPRIGIAAMALNPCDDLIRLQRTVSRQVAPLIPLKKSTKPYTPHVTLFRDVELMAEPPPLEPQRQMVSEFHLMESRFGAQGVSYHSLACWPLAPDSLKRLLLGSD